MFISDINIESLLKLGYAFRLADLSNQSKDDNYRDRIYLDININIWKLIDENNTHEEYLGALIKFVNRKPDWKRRIFCRR